MKTSTKLIVTALCLAGYLLSPPAVVPIVRNLAVPVFSESLVDHTLDAFYFPAERVAQNFPPYFHYLQLAHNLTNEETVVVLP